MPIFVKASYNEKTLTVEYIADNGDRLLRSGGTIAWRFNNPGNLRPGPKYTLHIGQGKTVSGPFLIFPSPEAGRAEKKGLLLRKYRGESINRMLHIYAPPKENDTERYIQTVCEKTGFSRDQIIGELPDEDLHRLMTAMEEHEGFHHKKETRKEHWVRVTTVSFSDGARPIKDLPVKLKRDDREINLKTDSLGKITPLVHHETGESIQVWAQNIEKEWIKLEAILLGNVSKAFMFVCDQFEVCASTQPHNPPSAAPPKTRFYHYVVQPGDTLEKIARKFNTDTVKIQKDNGIKNPDRIRAAQALLIKIGSPDIAKVTRERPASPSGFDTNRNNTFTSVATQERSKGGTGHPLAIVGSHQKRAPWMITALKEAELRAGQREDEIGKSINYHHQTGQRWFKSLSGEANAWCASFVNYCLMVAGYPMSINKARAKSFSMDSSFVEVDKPIYGAIAVFGRAGGGHAAFVYGKEKGTDKVIVIGGNQGDMITFVARSAIRGLIGYFVPLPYKLFADTEMKTELTEYQADSLNKELGITTDQSGREA